MPPQSLLDLDPEDPVGFEAAPELKEWILKTFIDDKNWALLDEQYDAMNWYYTLLVSRIELF